MCLALALTSLKQPPFVSIEHVYVDEVGPVLMMELASLMFFSGLLFNCYDFDIDLWCFVIFWQGHDHDR